MGWSRGNGGDETFQKYERFGHFWSTRCSTFCTLSPEHLDADAKETQAVVKFYIKTKLMVYFWVNNSSFKELEGVFKNIVSSRNSQDQVWAEDNGLSHLMSGTGASYWLKNTFSMGVLCLHVWETLDPGKSLSKLSWGKSS